MTVRQMMRYSSWIIALPFFLWIISGFGSSLQAQSRLRVPADYATIDEAYLAAADGDTIDVAAGTYRAIFLQIEKSIVIIGANFGIPAGSGRRAETIIEGDGFANVFNVGCNCDVTIDGLTVRPFGRFTVRHTSGQPALFFRNNRVINPDTSRGGNVLFTAASALTFSDNLFRKINPGTRPVLDLASCTNVVLQRNTIDSSYAGIRLAGVQASDRSNVVQYNVLRNLRSYGIMLSDSGRAFQNTLIAENTIDRANTLRIADIGALTLEALFVPTITQLTVRNNFFNASFNGIALRNLSDISGDQMIIRYNVLTNHSNAAVYHGGNGTLDCIANWWGDRFGPTDPQNPVGVLGLRIRALAPERVRYAPWIYRFTDSSADTAGIQLRRPTTYGIRKSFPRNSLPQSANDVAFVNDTLLYLETDFSAENLTVTKDMVMSTFRGNRPSLNDLRVGGDTVIKNLILNGNFIARNVNLNNAGAGGRIFAPDTLFFTNTINEDSSRHIIGTTQTTRTIGAGGSNFGAIGADISPGRDNVGTVIVTRITGPEGEQKPDGLTSPQIYFRLQTSGANFSSGRPVTFRFFRAFNNGVAPDNMVLWQRTDPFGKWIPGTAPRDLTGNPQVWTDTLRSRGEFTFSAPPRCKNLRVNAGRDTAACVGNLVFLSGRHSGGNGIVTYKWEPETGLSDPTLPNPTLNIRTRTVYTLTVTDSLGCTFIDDVIVAPLLPPTVNVGSSLNLCLGQTGQINATGAVAYIWEPSAGLSDPFSANPFVNVTRNTQYRVIGFGGNGCSDTVLVNVNIIESPIIERRQANVLICAGNSTGLQVRARGTDAPDLRYEWSPRTGLSSFSSPFTQASPTQTTVYTITVTNNYGCKSFDTVKVQVQPRPRAYAGEDKTICAGTRIQLRGTGGKTYLWGPTETMIGFDTDGPFVFPEETTTYFVQVTDSLGCTATDQVTVNVLPNPQANAEGQSAICSGESVKLNGFGGVTYYWSPPDLTDEPTLQNPTVRPLTTTTFTLRVTDEKGCNGFTFLTVNVNPRPEITVSESPAICLGETTRLRASGGVRYLWEPALYLDNPESAAPNARPEVETTYTVYVFNEQNCATTAEVTVFVNPIPLAFAGDDRIICPGQSTQMLAIDGTHYSWQPALGLSNPNIANPVAKPQETTTYTLTVQGRFGCTAVDSVTIFVLRNDEPLVRPSGTIFICNGGSRLLETFYRAEATYQWYLNGEKINGAFNVNYSAGLPGRYQVEITVNGCSVKSDEVMVTQGGNPGIEAGENQSICLRGTGVRLNAKGGISYQWKPEEGLSNPFIADPVANPVQTTLYTLFAIDEGGCAGRDSVLVIVNTSPNIQVFSEKDPTICFGERLRLSVRQVPFAEYRWLRDGVPLPETNAPVFFAESPGSYSCRVRVSGCDAVLSDNSITVTVLAPPIADAGPDFYVCTAGPGVRLRGRGEGPRGVQYRWEPNIGLSNTAVADPTALPTQTTVYTLTVVDGRGCRATDEVTVTVSPTAVLTPPRIEPTGDSRLCEGESITLSVPFTEGLTYQWLKDGSEIIGADTTILTVKTSGIYRVAVSSAGCGRQLSPVKAVVINPRPLVSAMVKDASCVTCFDGEIRLTISGGTPPYEISTQGILPTNVPNIINLQYGTYDVTVTDAGGCSVTVRAIVRPGPNSAEDALSAQSLIKIYPNPVKDYLTVEYLSGSAAFISVTDVTGRELIRVPALESKTLTDLSKLPAGVYTVIIESKTGVRTAAKVAVE